ncbi:MAG: glycosyltransferase family 4 protein [Ruminococcaceae bacterium]|nr:glycosyltransferase family 4 protein [Oscillospiraceae bacterium]
MKKRLLITSTDLMMVQFLLPHIQNLAENGYAVDIACSDVGGRVEEIKGKTKAYTENIFVLDLQRSPLSPQNAKGYKQLKQIFSEHRYDIVWTNEPVMGVATRLAAKKARKNGTTVLYMCHGFHFFNGAPKVNWLIYYPIEKLMAPRADCICTINTEDYKRAQGFKTKRVEYIHGIGINTDRLTPGENQNNIRVELGLSEDAFLVLSVGELNENKNQKVILKAVNKLNDVSIHYILCGKGDQLENLQTLTRELGIENNVHFLGYRTDVVDICSQADVYVMPSKREGLPVASLEAMYCGLPLVTSNIRGLSDIMENGVTGYMCEPDDVNAFATGIRVIKEDVNFRKTAAEKNKQIVVPYCIENTKTEVLNLLNSLEG